MINYSSIWSSISKKVFVNLSSEYDNWLKQQQIEKPTDEWVLYDNYILRNKDTQYSSFYKKEEDKDLVNKINELGKNAIYIDSFESGKQYIEKNCQKNDMLITMGAGNVYLLGEMLLNK